MNKIKSLLVAACTIVLVAFPLSGSANACPDPDNPCDIQPIDPKREVCRILGKNC